jgi:hypothetical protein
VVKRRTQGVPAQAGALHASGKFSDAREGCELAEFGWIDGGIVLRQQRVHFSEQSLEFRQSLASHGFGQE